jgi:hypothetical protein
MKMHWLISNQFFKDPKVRELIQNLVRMNVSHSYCRAIPFSKDDMTSDRDLDTIEEPIFTYGSYTLSKIVHTRGYRPGAFISPNIGLNHLLENYGDFMLNNDMEFCTLAESVEKIDGEMFLRPMEDTKSFVAEVVNEEDLQRFVDKVEGFGDSWSPITLDTMVAICKPKEIQQEIRFFVVDGEISTYSTYRIGTRVCYDGFVDENVKNFASSLVGFGNWTPDVAFCLDIAVSNDEPKILEVNSINSSGLYGIDTQKLIDSVNKLDRLY